MCPQLICIIGFGRLKARHVIMDVVLLLLLLLLLLLSSSLLLLLLLSLLILLLVYLAMVMEIIPIIILY